MVQDLVQVACQVDSFLSSHKAYQAARKRKSPRTEVASRVLSQEVECNRDRVGHAKESLADSSITLPAWQTLDLHFPVDVRLPSTHYLTRGDQNLYWDSVGRSVGHQMCCRR